MLPIMLVDGNNLGHVLGHIDKEADRYNNAGLVACLDGVARYLAASGQESEIVLFFDDVSVAERLGGWYVRLADVPRGNADAAIRAYAQQHAGRLQMLVSGDRALCGEVALAGVLCLSPEAFVSGYLIPARDGGFIDCTRPDGPAQSERVSYVEAGEEAPPPAQPRSPAPRVDQGERERRRQRAALKRTEAVLRGEPLPVPEVYQLDLGRWADRAELAVYLAENHLCPEHAHLTDPDDMIAAIRGHCCLQPRYFTSGRVINRVFRSFLCRAEHALSLDDLVGLVDTRRRKIRAAIKQYGEGLGIAVKSQM